VDDAVWQRVQPLLPPPKPRRARYPGRKPIDDRRALTGILYVLKTGIPWEELPQEMGCGSGMTCWRRLQLWQQTGAWPRIEDVLRAALPDADQIDWARASPDRRKREQDQSGSEGPGPPAAVGDPATVTRAGPPHPELEGPHRDGALFPEPSHKELVHSANGVGPVPNPAAEPQVTEPTPL
jgi:transposase